MAENERAAGTDAGRAVSRLSSGQALQQLLDGNKRYVSTNFAHPDQTAERRIEIANAQYPFACILGCSDSRVPAEIVFDQGLGDLFMVRVAGNVASSGEVLASIEFAVAELQVPLVLVLGHERCGAVTAAVDAVVRGSVAPGHIGSLVDAIRPAVARVRGRWAICSTTRCARMWNWWWRNWRAANRFWPPRCARAGCGLPARVMISIPARWTLLSERAGGGLGSGRRRQGGQQLGRGQGHVAAPP